MSDKKEMKQSGGKNIRAARAKLNSEKIYSASEAVKFLKENSYTKFDQTLEIVYKLGVDPRHSDQMVRGVVPLPAGTGKVARVAVICKDEKIEEAKKAGADLAGSNQIIDDIKAGKIEFDVCIATPDMMGMVGQVARVLGPKGLMPNPKLGTVTANIADAVTKAKSGQVEFRVEKAGIIHAGIGKLSFDADSLMQNAKAITSAIIKAKPSGSKGTYLKAIYLSSTMGPSMQVDTAELTQ